MHIKLMICNAFVTNDADEYICFGSSACAAFAHPSGLILAALTSCSHVSVPCALKFIYLLQVLLSQPEFRTSSWRYGPCWTEDRMQQFPFTTLLGCVDRIEAQLGMCTRWFRGHHVVMEERTTLCLSKTILSHLLAVGDDVCMPMTGTTRPCPSRSW